MSAKKKTLAELMKPGHSRPFELKVRDLWGREVSVYVKADTVAKLRKWRRSFLRVVA